MRRFFTRLLLLGTVLAACLFALANRQPVQIAFDFFAESGPWLVVEVPLFAVLFAAFFIGLLLGGATRLFGRRQ